MEWIAKMWKEIKIILLNIIAKCPSNSIKNIKSDTKIVTHFSTQSKKKLDLGLSIPKILDKMAC